MLYFRPLGYAFVPLTRRVCPLGTVPASWCSLLMTVCVFCVPQAEARLAAKRAARAEARDIRMRELERQQKEVYDMYHVSCLQQTPLGIMNWNRPREFGKVSVIYPLLHDTCHVWMRDCSFLSTCSSAVCSQV